MMSRPAFFEMVAATVPLVAVLAACSSSGAAAARVAEGDFNQKYAETVCDGAAKCCAIGQYPYDRAACIAQWRRTSDVAPVAGLTYNAENAGECIARLRAQTSCEDDIIPGYEDFLAYCQAVYTGTKQPGEACTGAQECAATSQGHAFCVQGVCKVTPTNHDGDACSQDDFETDCNAEQFASDLYCGADGHCHKLKAVGEPCDTYRACDLSGTCSAAGVCVPRGQAGAQCSNTTPCARGLYCPRDANLNVIGGCTPEKRPGETCTAGVDKCFDGICSEGRCSASGATADFCAGRTPPTGN